MKMYSSIITKRICTSRFEPSLFEKGAYAAIDYHGAKEDFELLIVTDNEYYLCDCIEKSGRLRINAMQSAGHNLGTTLFNNHENKGLETCFQIIDGMVSIDPMFENMIAQQIKDIASSLSSIKPSGKGKLYLHGQLSESLLFRYALQKYYGVRELAIVDDEKPVKSDGRTLFPNSVFNEPLNLNIPDGLIVKYITKPGCQMMLPLTDATLEAKVWNSSPLTWGDIIPDREADLTIAGVECKSITLNFSIDIFGNIISRVYGSDGKKAVRLFKNAMNANIRTDIMAESKMCTQPQKPEPSTPAKTEIKRQAEMIPLSEKKRKTYKVGKKTFTIPKTLYIFNEELHAKSKALDKLETQGAIIEKDSCVTYEHIYGRYLAGAVEIFLKDPYVVQTYQIENLREFINTAINASKLTGMPVLEKFHLITFPASHVSPDEEQKQKDMLDELAKNLNSEENIRFTYEFKVDKDLIHDRHLELSNGWFIGMGRGLDIFMKKDKLKRRFCKEAEISYLRIEDIIKPINGLLATDIKQIKYVSANINCE